MGKRKNLLVFKQITRDFLTEVFFSNSHSNHPYLFPSFFSPFRAQTFSVQTGLSWLCTRQAAVGDLCVFSAVEAISLPLFFLFPSPRILPSFLEEIKFLSTPPATR